MLEGGVKEFDSRSDFGLFEKSEVVIDGGVDLVGMGEEALEEKDLGLVKVEELVINNSKAIEGRGVVGFE